MFYATDHVDEEDTIRDADTGKLNMDNVKLELSKRYYIAEATVWLLGATLIFSRFIGLDASQPVPVLNVILEDKQNYPRVVAALLIATAFYLIIEWKQSSRKARKSYWSLTRAGSTILFAGVSLWLSYPLIAANTGFAGVSPGWFLAFLTIGFFLGGFASILVFSSLMIRTPTEAKSLRLPRVPNATRAQYKTWIPVVFLLVIAFYILRHYSPEILKEFGLGFVLVSIPFLLIIGEEFSWLCLSQDENGNRIPLAKRIARLKEVFNSHDYSYHLIDRGREAAEESGIDRNVSPQEIQKAMQEMYSVESRTGSYYVEVKEGIAFELYSKDGDPENQSRENRGVRIKRQKGKKDLLRVLIHFDDPEMESQEVEIPINLIETHAEEYLSTHIDDANSDSKKFISYALNMSTLQTITEDAGPFLHRTVQAGLEHEVKELLKQDIDVNERAEAGWTALLYASAQGYPQIVRLLLDAGANPDIGNVHSITPLMYGARYDNLEVCRCLLEHGANTDLQDKYGDSALMVATAYGHADLVEELLNAGANIALKNRDDNAALDIAHDRKQGEIAKKLRRAAKQG